MELNLSFFLDLHTHTHTYKTVVYADDFTEDLHCQRELASHSANSFKLGVKYLVFICLQATLATTAL